MDYDYAGAWLSPLNQILALVGDEGLYLLRALCGLLEMPSSLWDHV